MKLKRCPFCGSKNITIGFTCCQCDDCLACGPDNTAIKTPEEMWNSRYKKKSKWIANTGVQPNNLPEKFKVRLSSKEVIVCNTKQGIDWTFTDDPGDIIAWKPIK